MKSLTLARLDDDGCWVIPGPHEGRGQGEGRDVEVTGEKVLMTDRAEPGQTYTGEHLLVTVRETQQLEGQRLRL